MISVVIITVCYTSGLIGSPDLSPCEFTYENKNLETRELITLLRQ